MAPPTQRPSAPPAPGGPRTPSRGEEPQGPAPPGLVWGWVVPLLAVGAINLATRRVAESASGAPLRPLAFFCAMMAALMLWDRLRSTLPRALAVVLAAAVLVVGLRHREAISSHRMALGDLAAEAIHAGTGLGRGVGEALRVSALGEGGATPFARYLDKFDPRSSEVVILASHLAKGCESADHLCESSAILRFVTDEIAYRADPRGGEDYVKSPAETLAAGAGDCEDKSILLASLLEAIGNRTFLVFTRDHVWPMVCFEQPLPEQWRRRTSRMSPEERDAYARLLGPRGAGSQSAAEIERQIEGAPEIEIDDRACYAVEPTAAGSYFGVVHEAREYLIAVDPVARRTIDLTRAGISLTR